MDKDHSSPVWTFAADTAPAPYRRIGVAPGTATRADPSANHRMASDGGSGVRPPAAHPRTTGDRFPLRYGRFGGPTPHDRTAPADPGPRPERTGPAVMAAGAADARGAAPPATRPAGSSE